MSVLLQIIKEAKENYRGHEEDWLALRTYFRGEEPYGEVEAWANKNGLVATFLDGGPFEGTPPRAVHFRVR